MMHDAHNSVTAGDAAPVRPQAGPLAMRYAAVIGVFALVVLGDARRSYERGQLDGFFGTVVELLPANDQGGRHPIAALVADDSSGADVIVTRAGISTVDALRDRRIGYERHSLNGYVLAYLGRTIDRVGEVLLATGQITQRPPAAENLVADVGD